MSHPAYRLGATGINPTSRFKRSLASGNPLNPSTTTRAERRRQQQSTATILSPPHTHTHQHTLIYHTQQQQQQQQQQRQTHTQEEQQDEAPPQSAADEDGGGLSVSSNSSPSNGSSSSSSGRSSSSSSSASGESSSGSDGDDADESIVSRRSVSSVSPPSTSVRITVIGELRRKKQKYKEATTTTTIAKPPVVAAAAAAASPTDKENAQEERSNLAANESHSPPAAFPPASTAAASPAVSSPLPYATIAATAAAPPSGPRPVFSPPFPAPSVVSHPHIQTTSTKRNANVTPPSPPSSSSPLPPGTSRRITVEELLNSRFDSNYDHPGQPLWICVENANAQLIAIIGSHFDLHPLTIEDCQSRHTREKLEIFQHYLFLVFTSLQTHHQHHRRHHHHHHQTHQQPTSKQTDKHTDTQTHRASKRQRQKKHVSTHTHTHTPSRSDYECDESYDGRVCPDADDEDEDEDARARRRQQRQSGKQRTVTTYSDDGEVDHDVDADSDSASMRTSPIKLIVFPHLVLSFTEGSSFSTTRAVRMRLKKVYLNRLESTAWIIHAMLDCIVDALLPVVDGTVVEVDALEDLIYVLSGSEHRDLLKRMGLTRRRLSFLRQRLWSKRDILMSLIGKDWQLFLAGVQIPYLRDVYDHVVTMLHKVEAASELLGSLQNTYLANVSIDVADQSKVSNEIMKNLSAVATIVLPLSLIAGIMGMNVEVPWQHDAENDLATLAPFIVICGGMVVVTVIMIVYFKAKNLM